MATEIDRLSIPFSRTGIHFSLLFWLYDAFGFEGKKDIVEIHAEALQLARTGTAPSENAHGLREKTDEREVVGDSPPHHREAPAAIRVHQDKEGGRPVDPDLLRLSLFLEEHGPSIGLGQVAYSGHQQTEPEVLQVTLLVAETPVVVGVASSASARQALFRTKRYALFY